MGCRIRIALFIVIIALAGTVAFADQGLSQDQIARIRAFPEVGQLSVDANGVPTLIAGRLGFAGFGPVDRAAPGYVATLLPLFKGRGEEHFRTLRVHRDEHGEAHVRLGQEFRGLPIVGAELIVHVNETTGEVSGVNGRFVPADRLPVKASVDWESAFATALRQIPMTAPQLLESPYLTYVLDHGGAPHLAWAARYAYWDDEGYQQDRLFADATDGRLVAKHPLIWRAKFRKIYTAGYTFNLPGTLMFQEGGSSSDVSAQKAYDYSGNAYDYFWARHSRDSWNGSGGQLISTVHVGSAYNNAFWDGSQLAFGDGDGVEFGPFSRSLDVVAHEMAHGVTQATANLTYSGESGALNEAMSDIFGAATEAYVRGVSSNVWKVGEEIYTPSISGDAMRYMNNPTADGDSKDYYPERYTGGDDNGGVHWNSGIANLAFYLLSNGGTHPRGKTSVNVPNIGMVPAERVFYRALSAHMGASTNFAGARDATHQGAVALYGPCSTQTDAFTKAWDAVGVPRNNGREYEPNDERYQASQMIPYSDYAVGYICSSGNADWYQINKVYSSSLLYISLYPPSTRDYDLELWQGNQIAASYNTGNGVGETIMWYYGSGIFYIKVIGKNGQYSTTSSYGLSVSQ